jgi:hypothetical protein
MSISSLRTPVGAACREHCAATSGGRGAPDTPPPDEAAMAEGDKKVQAVLYRDPLVEWLKNKFIGANKMMTPTEKAQKIIRDTAVGAFTGATLLRSSVASIATSLITGATYGIGGVAMGTVVGAVAGGALRARQTGESIFNSGMKTGAIVGAASLGSLGTIGGIMSGYAKGYVFTWVADKFGGGMMGGAIAGGMAAGIYSAAKIAIKEKLGFPDLSAAEPEKGLKLSTA